MRRYTLLICLLLSNLILSAQEKRPQEPKPPFKYKEVEVEFMNSADKIKLSGTLTYPSKGSNFPAVILISGSGPQDRNSELLGHKPFLVIADYLTKKGMAVLRVDDRGSGASEGDYNTSGLENFVRDTESALEFLKSRKEIDSNQIGLIGHSLGGVIAPIIAGKRKDVAFIVLLAGSGIRGDSLMLLQKAGIERRMKVPEAAIEISKNRIGGAYKIVLQSKGDTTELKKELEDYFAKTFGSMLSEKQLKGLSRQLSTPWLADFIRYDPAIALSQTSCPVLAMIGSNDLQVPPKENLHAIDSILKANGNTKVTVVELAGLNHLFQKSETGLPQEYAKIEQTFSPKALKQMSKWIEEQVE